MTDKRLCKRHKIRKRPEFQKISRQGRRLTGQFICIDWLLSDRPETRLGITASGKYGAAHERNRFKRLIREAFRTARGDLPKGMDLNIIPRRYALKATLDAVQKELIFLLKTIDPPCR